MFDSKQDLKLSVINQTKKFFKDSGKLIIIYTKLKNIKYEYEEVCLIFDENKENFIYHNFYGTKDNDGYLTSNNTDFSFKNDLSIDNLKEFITDEILIKKADFFIKKRAFNNLEKLLPGNVLKEKKNKI